MNRFPSSSKNAPADASGPGLFVAEKRAISVSLSLSRARARARERQNVKLEERRCESEEEQVLLPSTSATLEKMNVVDVFPHNLFFLSRAFFSRRSFSSDHRFNGHVFGRGVAPVGRAREARASVRWSVQRGVCGPPHASASNAKNEEARRGKPRETSDAVFLPRFLSPCAASGDLFPRPRPRQLSTGDSHRSSAPVNAAFQGP